LRRRSWGGLFALLIDGYQRDGELFGVAALEFYGYGKNGVWFCAAVSDFFLARTDDSSHELDGRRFDEQEKKEMRGEHSSDDDEPTACARFVSHSFRRSAGDETTRRPEIRLGSP